jgi:sodium transport system permease protein
LLDVFRKELMDMLRDKRVRSAAFVMPVLLIFMMLFLFGTVLANVGKPQATVIHFVGSAGSPVYKAIEKAGFKITSVGSIDNARKMLDAGSARVVVAPQPAVAGETAVKLLFDESEQMSVIAKERVVGVIGGMNQEVLAKYLVSSNVPAVTVNPYKATPENVRANKPGGVSDILVGFLPYLIVIWAFFGGMNIAGDLVAGEKEKQTLETLLITPLTRTQVVMGKLIALATICLTSSMASLLGLGIYALIKPKGSELILANGIGISAMTILLTLVLLIPLVILFASLLILASSYAKNVREAQTYLSLGSFVVMLPAIFSQFIGFTDYGRSVWIHFVPVLNTANNLRMILQGKPDFTGISYTVVTGLVLGAIASSVVVWMFNREELLVRS